MKKLLLPTLHQRNAISFIAEELYGKITTRYLTTERRIPQVDPKVSIAPYDKDPGANIHLINQLRHRQLGPVYAEKIGPDVEVVFVSDPELCEKVFKAEGPHPKHLVPRAWEVYNELHKVKRGLFFTDGSEWSCMRSRLNKIFFAPDYNNGLPNFAREPTDHLLDKLQAANHNDTSKSVDNLESLLSVWSVESMLSYLFGSAYARDKDTNVLVENVQNIFRLSVDLQFTSADEEAAKSTTLWQNFSSSVTNALQLAKNITERNINSCHDGLVHDMRGVFDNTDEITTIAVDLIIAAADTTATTALWTLHLLAVDRAHQDKVIQLKEEYARWCIQEAMRMFPVAPFITRIIPNELHLGKGYSSIPAGQLVLLSTYAMGRNDSNFPMADTFWPRRFMRRSDSSGRLGVLQPYAFLPFGHGARGCVGRKVAMDQLGYLVSRTVELFELRSLNSEPVQMTMRFTGVPDRKIMLSCTPRI